MKKTFLLFFPFLHDVDENWVCWEKVFTRRWFICSVKTKKARNCVQHFLHFLSAFLIGFFSFGLHNFSSDYGDIIKLCRNV